jgi:hypothetical protein
MFYIPLNEKFRNLLMTEHIFAKMAGIFVINGSIQLAGINESPSLLSCHFFRKLNLEDPPTKVDL